MRELKPREHDAPLPACHLPHSPPDNMTSEHALLNFLLSGVPAWGRRWGLGFAAGCVPVRVATLGTHVHADVVSGPGKEP